MTTPSRTPPSARHGRAGSGSAKRATTAQMKATQPAPGQRPTATDLKPPSQRIAAQPKRSPSGRVPAQEPSAKESSARLRSQSPQTKPSSARIAAQGKRPASSTRNPAPSTGRHATGSSGTGRHKADSSKSARRSSGKRSGKLPAIIVGCLVILAVIAVIAWGPVNRSMKIKAMDAAKTDPTKMPEALKAADDFVAMVQDPARVKEVILGGHGPAEVQIQLAKGAQLFPQLISIAERTETTGPQRAAALNAAAEVYGEKSVGERLPTKLDEWAKDAQSPDDVASAAIVLVAKVGGDDVVPTLARIAGTADIAETRLTASLDGMAKALTGASVGHAMGLLQGPNRDRVLAHAAIKTAMEKNSGGSLDRLVDFAMSDNQPLRVFALECLGKHAVLADNPDNDAKRRNLSGKFRPYLVKTTPPDVLAGLIKADKKLGLSPTIDDLLVLAADIDTLALPEVDKAMLAECFGKDFILTKTTTSKQLTEDVLAKLSKSLDNAKLRSVAALALGQVKVPELAGLRPAIDKLAAVGDKDCIDAVKSLVGQTIGRPDVVKVNGDKADAWQKWLAEDKVQFERVNAIKKWYGENSQTTRISDGKDKLGANDEYIKKAKGEIDSWLKNPKWVPPLGMTKKPIEDLNTQLKMTGKEVGTSLAGAKQ
ncbi:MAG: hypothetical protein H0V44_19085 [Planctomycetes bacterium]|nr:hypothetical protein [Planctomycetota bacterium]